MIFDDAEPQIRKGGALAEVEREDLDLYALEDCEDRIRRLEAEIARVRAAMNNKSARKSAADALFNLGSG